LLGLARNPALPPALLDRFIASAGPAALDEIAERDDLSPQQVRDLIEAAATSRPPWSGEAVCRRLTFHPSTYAWSSGPAALPGRSAGPAARR